MAFQVKRYHDISCGHRVVGHESKCRHLHGHNYRIHFVCQSEELDDIGRVIDFGVVKKLLCMWVERNWDHKFLAWDEDEVMDRASDAMSREFHVKKDIGNEDFFNDSLVFVPFNPTAENLAQYLVTEVGPEQLQGTGIKLVEVLIEETAKCHASFKVDL